MFGISRSGMGRLSMPLTEMPNMCVSAVMFAYSMEVSHVWHFCAWHGYVTHATQTNAKHENNSAPVVSATFISFLYGSTPTTGCHNRYRGGRCIVLLRAVPSPLTLH